QAEDGIRDKLVTGVQTCALPILRPQTRAGCNAHVNVARLFDPDRIAPPDRSCARDSRVNTDDDLVVLRRRAQDARIRWQISLGRSEERRVGKECRDEWARAHEKK